MMNNSRIHCPTKNEYRGCFRNIPAFCIAMYSGFIFMPIRKLQTVQTTPAAMPPIHTRALLSFMGSSSLNLAVVKAGRHKCTPAVNCHVRKYILAEWDGVRLIARRLVWARPFRGARQECSRQNPPESDQT